MSSFPVTERIQKSLNEAITDSGVPDRRGGGDGADERLPDRPDERRRAELRVLRRELAGLDPVRDHPGERVAVGPPEDEALGLDGADRPAPRSTPRRAAARAAPAARRSRRPRDAGDGGAARFAGGGGDGVDLVLGRLAEDLGEQVGLRREVAIDGAGGDPRPRGDRRDLGLGVPAPGDQSRAAATMRRRVSAFRATVRSVGRYGTKEVNQNSFLASRRGRPSERASREARATGDGTRVSFGKR